MSNIFFEETKSEVRNIYVPKKSLLEKWLASKGISRFQYSLLLSLVFLTVFIVTYSIFQKTEEDRSVLSDIESIDQRLYETKR